jgi:hypothetical protein
MMKKQQKWIALIVTLTFLWLLQVSTMPVAAASAAEQTVSVNTDQRPGFVETVGHKAAPAPKKSIVPYILIGVGAVAVAAVLILVVFKKSYDIRGTWKFEYLKADGTVFSTNLNVLFSGTNKTGTMTVKALNTTYSVDGKAIVIAELPGQIAKHEATFIDDDNFSGTWAYSGGDPGNFRAIRTAAAATSLPAPQSSSSLPPRVIK